MSQPDLPVSLPPPSKRPQLGSKQLAIRRYVFLIFVALHLALLWRYSGLYSTSSFEVFSMPLRVPALAAGIAGCLALYVGTIVLFVRPERSRVFFALSFLLVGASTLLWIGVYGRWAVPMFATVLAGMGWAVASLFSAAQSPAEG